MSPPLEELLADDELLRLEFPVGRTRTYLAHAAVAPLPRRVAQAMCDYVLRASAEGQFERLNGDVEASTRRIAADMIGATPEEIAFVPSTSAGLSTVAAGLDWTPGDRVLIFEGDFPANTYPWFELERRGVAVDLIPWSPTGLVRVEDVDAAMRPRTRLVALSSVHYLTGAPIDVGAIGELAHARGALLMLDAIQSLGVFPCPSRNVDFLAADAHKWLLGPQGVGLLYVKREHLERVRPPSLGWKSVRSPRAFHETRQELADSAKRYEPGGLNNVGLVGLHAALELSRSAGLEAISGRVAALRQRIVSELSRRGREVLGPEGGPLPTGIASWRPRPHELADVLGRLEARNVVVSVRHDMAGASCVRAAPHFYTTDAELEAFLACV